MSKFKNWLATNKNEAWGDGAFGNGGSFTGTSRQQTPQNNQQPGNMQAVASQASAKLKEALSLLAKLKTVASGWEQQVGEMEQQISNLAGNLQYMADK